MHNHGFGHYAGMTYGLPELLTEYTKEGFLENFYNDQALINSMTSATVALDVIDVDIDYLDLHFSFYTNDSESLNEDEYIDQFLLVLPDSINISHIQVKQSGIVKDLTANSTFADGQALYFDQDISIKILPFSEQKSEDKDQLIIRIERPDYAGDMAFLASGQQAPWSRQANKLVQITPEYGLKADSNRLVYFSPTGIYSHDTDLQLELGYHTFTPTEAAEYCSDKGLTLGMLETYQSEAQMDFQSLYLKYGSQVGIDPDTLEPVAVNVPTTYRPEVVEYIDAGKLVVCSYE
ncbi:hypothetical protein [Vibrio sp. B1FLJ16]|nr:hypothetical protein [Vibrio sp. B1FLJ16]